MMPCPNIHVVRRIRNVLWLELLLCGTLRAEPPAGYRLAWQDEFNGSTLDEAKWQYRTDTRYWSKQLPRNVSVADGVVNLHLKKETVDAVDYKAGGVISRELFRYGYYEDRMKVPPGGGWHTSFWMMKYNRPATDTVAIELDVIENDSATPSKYAVNVHRRFPLPHVTFGTKTVNTPSLSAGFHVFGCEFTPQAIRCFFDGTLVKTVDANLLEWALNLDAGAPSVFQPVWVKTGNALEFTYTRRKTAPGEAAFSVEWSNHPGEAWPSVGVVTEAPVSVSTTMESVRATVPATGDPCFVSLKVTTP